MTDKDIGVLPTYGLKDCQNPPSKNKRRLALLLLVFTICMSGMFLWISLNVSTLINDKCSGYIDTNFNNQGITHYTAPEDGLLIWSIESLILTLLYAAILVCGIWELLHPAVVSLLSFPLLLGGFSVGGTINTGLNLFTKPLVACSRIGPYGFCMWYVLTPYILLVAGLCMSLLFGFIAFVYVFCKMIFVSLRRLFFKI